MASSLAAQLTALQPEVRSRRGQASLLFDDREAEKFTVQTVFEIGLAGFSELCRAEPAFRSFEGTLFSTSAMEFDRDLQSAEVNKQLDASLDAFLAALSPHYLLKGAHKAMEFLVRRFRWVEFRLRVPLPPHPCTCPLPPHSTGCTCTTWMQSWHASCRTTRP